MSDFLKIYNGNKFCKIYDEYIKEEDSYVKTENPLLLLFHNKEFRPKLINKEDNIKDFKDFLKYLPKEDYLNILDLIISDNYYKDNFIDFYDMYSDICKKEIYKKKGITYFNNFLYTAYSFGNDKILEGLKTREPKLFLNFIMCKKYLDLFSNLNLNLINQMINQNNLKDDNKKYCEFIDLLKTYEKNKSVSIFLEKEFLILNLKDIKTNEKIIKL